MGILIVLDPALSKFHLNFGAKKRSERIVLGCIAWISNFFYLSVRAAKTYSVRALGPAGIPAPAGAPLAPSAKPGLLTVRELLRLSREDGYSCLRKDDQAFVILPECPVRRVHAVGQAVKSEKKSNRFHL